MKNELTKAEKTKLRKAAKKQVDELNAVIHRRNLYIVREGGNNRRVINAHLDIALGAVVEDLHNGVNYIVQGATFVDGYGETLKF